MSSAFAHSDHRASFLRAQIEASLSGRFAGALSPAPREVRETLGTGVEVLDTMLGGGVPVGAITELAGPMSSGRTTVALSTVASAMREGYMCAWVDASDAFDPESAAANGVCLERLLWVRCGVQGSNASPVAIATNRVGKGPSGRMEAQPSAGRAGQHPRDEVRGLDVAVGALLQERNEESPRRNRLTGTPGAPNRSLFAAEQENRPVERRAGGRVFSPVRRNEQAPSDRQPSRRAVQGMQTIEERLARAEDGDKAGSNEQVPRPDRAFADRGKIKPWARLDQALRATDLLLQAGGFRVLVLDLGSIAPEHGLRIPLATWFRFRATADTGRTVLLLLTQASCAKSSAGLVLQLDGLEPVGVTLRVLEGIRYQVRPMRQRFSRPIAMDRFAERSALQAGLRPEARRPPQATWQLSAYPQREQGGSA